jgi:hypothetical protein
MHFRTKVFTLFLIMAIVTSLLIAALLYRPTKALFLDLMRTNVLSVAAITAAMLDRTLTIQSARAPIRILNPTSSSKESCGARAMRTAGVTSM